MDQWGMRILYKTCLTHGYKTDIITNLEKTWDCGIYGKNANFRQKLRKYLNKTSQGEECRPHGALWPAQVVLRLDQQIHQRKAICLTSEKTLLKNSLLEHFKEIHFWKIHHKCSFVIPAESHLFLRFIYKQKLVINSNWHHEPLYNKNNERWMLGCWVHTQ